MRVNRAWFRVAARRLWHHFDLSDLSLSDTRPLALLERIQALNSKEHAALYHFAIRGLRIKSSLHPGVLDVPFHGHATRHLTTFTESARLIELFVSDMRYLNAIHVDFDGDLFADSAKVIGSVLVAAKGLPIQHVALSFVPAGRLFGENLKAWTGLQSLSLGASGASKDADKDKFAGALERFAPESIRKLKLDMKAFKDNKELGVLFGRLPNLEQVDLCSVPFKTSGTIMRSLAQNTGNLKQLKLEFREYGAFDDNLHLVLTNCKALEWFYFAKVVLDASAVGRISNAVAALPQFQGLALGFSVDNRSVFDSFRLPGAPGVFESWLGDGNIVAGVFMVNKTGATNLMKPKHWVTGRSLGPGE